MIFMNGFTFIITYINNKAINVIFTNKPFVFYANSIGFDLAQQEASFINDYSTVSTSGCRKDF